MVLLIVLSVIGKLQVVFPGVLSVGHGLNPFIVGTVTAFSQKISQNVLTAALLRNRDLRCLQSPL